MELVPLNIHEYMKRNIDLVRKILLEIEKKEKPEGWLNIEFSDFSDAEISYHVKILTEAGFIESRNHTTKDGFNWVPVNLTWEGHEFLDASRNENIWQKTKKIIGENAGSTSFAILKELLIKVGMAQFGI